MRVTSLLRGGALAPLLLFALAAALPARAQGLQPVPDLTGRVVDRAGALSASELSTLDQKLAAFEDRKGSQVAVLIVPSTQPEEIEQYSIRVAEKWKVGRKKIDDGAILVVALGDHAMRIEVGYGLEGALTDIASKRIIEDIIKPHFQTGDFSGGIDAGVDAIMKVIDGEALPEPARRHRGGGSGGGQAGPVALVVIALFVGGILRSTIGRFGGGFLTGGIVGVVGALILGSLIFGVFAGLAAFLWVLFGNIGGPRRGGWGGGGWGGGSFGGGFGGGSGGGFSGGGGSFGGGGASGRW